MLKKTTAPPLGGVVRKFDTHHTRGRGSTDNVETFTTSRVVSMCLCAAFSVQNSKRNNGYALVDSELKVDELDGVA